MSKPRKQNTRVVINGIDVSASVTAANLPRYPEQVEVVELKMFVSGLHVDPDGTLNIQVDTT